MHGAQYEDALPPEHVGGCRDLRRAVEIGQRALTNPTSIPSLASGSVRAKFNKATSVAIALRRPSPPMRKCAIGLLANCSAEPKQWVGRIRVPMAELSTNWKDG